ncbi:MAG: TetR-like C-terminal domain-containing protein [Peptococcaceae bacterium]|nr:TetR-like C-terminal domain-containing protein [Peptococcaceae bacterium]
MSSSQLTKRALANSLKELMQHTQLNKISVQNITDSCGLNRQTFYYHFHDIFELLGWIYATEAIDSVDAYKNYTNWPEGLQRIFMYIERNRAFCLNTLNSLGRDHLDTYLYAVTFELIMGVVIELAADLQVEPEAKKFLANFYTLAFSGLVIQWMKNGMKDKPELIISRLSELLEGNFLKALQRYAKG